MNSVTEDVLKPRRISGYHLTMISLAVLVIAVALTTIFGSSSASSEDKLTAKSAVRISATNPTPNPDVTLDCEKPVLTLALALDRSGSVSGVSTNEAEYKKAVKDFLDELSGRIVSRGGELNVVLWAFASRSIIQNDKTPSNQLIIQVNDEDSLDAMKDTVDKIYFTSNPSGNMNGGTDGYSTARGYNAGFPTTGTNYQYTNWHDALIQTEKYRPTTTRPIDLALVLTDGMPNFYTNGDDYTNGTNLVYNEDLARTRAAEAVTRLRTRSEFKKVAVQGVLIKSNETNAMNEVFGPEGTTWSRASNFKTDLDRVLNKIIERIETDEICKIEYVKPSIGLSLNRENVNVQEGQSQTVTATITNNTVATNGVKLALVDVVVTVNGTEIYRGRLEPGQVITRTIDVGVSLGGTYPATTVVKVVGYWEQPAKKYRLDKSLVFNAGPNRYRAEATDTFNTSIKRLPLPA